MAIPYKVRQASIPNKEGKKLYHPQVVLIGSTDLNQLSREVAELSSLSTGDVKNSIDNLITVMTRHLQSGESVSLDGLGSFTPSLRSRGKGAESAEEVNVTNARLKINFRPASTRNTDRTIATRSLMTGSTFVKWGVEQSVSATPPAEDDSDSSTTTDPDNTESGDGTEGNPF